MTPPGPWLVVRDDDILRERLLAAMDEAAPAARLRNVLDVLRDLDLLDS